jgi:hypothetical protein
MTKALLDNFKELKFGCNFSFHVISHAIAYDLRFKEGVKDIGIILDYLVL